MNKNRTIFFIITIFSLSFILSNYKSLFIFKQKQKISKNSVIKPAKTEKENTPEIIIHDFYMQENNKNKSHIWTINSKEGKVFKKSNLIECYEVMCNLEKEKKEIAKLYSNKSILNRNTKNIFLCGDVIGNFKELNFYGKEINYNFSDQTIKTVKKIKYSYPNFNLVAGQSLLDIEKNKISMNNGIKCEIFK